MKNYILKSTLLFCLSISMIMGVSCADKDSNSENSRSLKPPAISVDDGNHTDLGAVPDAPSDLDATTISRSQIDLLWTDNSSNEDNFRIERWPAGEWWNKTEIGTAGAGNTSYQDMTVSPLTYYAYGVRAYSATEGYSEYSDTAYAMTNDTNLTLPAPSNLNANPISNSKVDLSWTDNSGGALSFKIERWIAGQG